MFERFYPGMSWDRHRDVWPLAEHSRFVSAGGVDWHVQVLGSGPCMLLLHGTGSGSFSWRELLPALAQRHTVVAPDLPGHAFSGRGGPGGLSLQGMADSLRQLLRQMNLLPKGLVGHSAGAAVAAQMVLHDTTLDRATLIGLNPAWLPLPGPAAWFLGPAAKLAAWNPLSAWACAKLAAQPGAVAQLIRSTGSTLDARGLDLYQRVLSDPGHLHGVLTMMAQWRLSPLSEALHRIPNPVYLDIGAGDQAIPPSLADEACRRLPQAVARRREGLGHLAHEEDPVGAAQQILQWCAV
ncbi:MAG: alpha/beta fold hydrolase [Hylemonella sp.]|uniref:alpha/beta fold hydrolase BchO n=1 Tax=Hylemonella sp. TaxID=2066020 RepID=UPI0022BD21E2|nr:alpha/beta fold hydrolase BchO [Hylemonella sp.]MCZ8253830.1 alpha/beta fold hydrolase [Hylemonella sp.]